MDKRWCLTGFVLELTLALAFLLGLFKCLMISIKYQYKRQSPICPVLKHGPRSLLYVRVIECSKLIGVMKVKYSL